MRFPILTAFALCAPITAGATPFFTSDFSTTLRFELTAETWCTSPGGLGAECRVSNPTTFTQPLQLIFDVDAFFEEDNDVYTVTTTEQTVRVVSYTLGLGDVPSFDPNQATLINDTGLFSDFFKATEIYDPQGTTLLYSDMRFNAVRVDEAGVTQQFFIPGLEEISTSGAFPMALTSLVQTGQYTNTFPSLDQFAGGGVFDVSDGTYYVADQMQLKVTDLNAAPIPLPAGVWLGLSALAGLVGLRRFQAT